MSAGLRRERQSAIRDLIASRPISSQTALAEALSQRGFAVTQATVSRDIAELGLLKTSRAAGAVYVTPEELSAPAGPARSDAHLRRILHDVPLTVGRSGLILVLTGDPGTASVVGQAIDESSLTDQLGTLAGDNTLLILFADEPSLERWLVRFEALRAATAASAVPKEASRQ